MPPFFDCDNALGFVGNIRDDNPVGRMWFEVVDDELELSLAHDRPDMPVMVFSLPFGWLVFEPVARLVNRSVYRATGLYPERAELPHSQYVELTASSLHSVGLSVPQEGGSSHG